MIETQLTELTEALRENTLEMRKLREALQTRDSEPETIKAPSKSKGAKPAPQPAAEEPAPQPAAEEPAPQPAAEEPAPQPAAEETTTDHDLTPTKVPASKPSNDTPHIPAAATPGQPPAGEYVDVDEVISQIQATVKDKLKAAAVTNTVEEVKDAWTAYRKSLGVNLITELRNDPVRLVAALKKAQSL